jgi:hypothetical protein
MFIPTQIRDSAIFGKGLFTTQAVNRGTIVCFFALGGDVITETEFIAGCEQQDMFMMRTGTRYVGRYFTYSRQAADSNFLNHSFEPSLLVHCGIVIARRDIAAQEELTVDYRYLLDTSDVGLYRDAASGREIRGLPPRQAFLETAAQFARIIEGVEGWEER